MERLNYGYSHPETALPEQIELLPAPESTSTIIGDLALRFLIGHSLTPQMFGLGATESFNATASVDMAGARAAEGIIGTVYVAEVLPINRRHTI